jgi:hypothetical protein
MTSYEQASVSTNNEMEAKIKMNLKRFSLSFGVSVGLLVVCCMALPAFASPAYLYERAHEESGGWSIWAETSITYDDATYIIDQGASNQGCDAAASWPMSRTITGYRESMTSYNAEVFLSADFQSGNDDWTIEVWTWAYPSYWQDPSGSSTRWI